MESAQPNWAEQVTAWGTVALAVGTAALAIAAIVALLQIRESRRARNTQVAVEFATRWNDAAYRQVRTKVDRAAKGQGGLKQAMIDHHANLTDDYRLLLMEPDFFEDLGVVVDHGAIDFQIVVDSLGRTICLRWDVWRPFVQYLRDERDMKTAFKGFQDLAVKIQEAEALAARKKGRRATAG